jgi:uncharacterized protein YndB with AHSA1/START domain
MIEPIQIAFEVDVPPDRAFTVWTERIGRWWPPSHTVSGAPASVLLEGRRGGRIYEVGPDGTEHDWGEVTAWEPPSRLGYLWHLRRDRRDATDVEVRFVPIGDRTRVEIEHRGWERLGSDGEASRDANRGGWASLLPHYVQACTEEDD